MGELDLSVEEALRKLLDGKLTIEEAKRKLSALNIERVADLARLDLGRAHRTGVPELILAEGKEPNQAREIAILAAGENGYALVTRVDERAAEALGKDLPAGLKSEHNQRARTVLVRAEGYEFPELGKVGVLAAGTADIPVAEEASVAAEVMGCEAIRAYDVGVAGLHRLFEPLERMASEGVGAVVAVAGMEGALPSVVAGLVDVPVIGVPTSVGYGVGVEGVGALITMLQSCSPKVAVVNIDNGVAAGVFAALVARRK